MEKELKKLYLNGLSVNKYIKYIIWVNKFGIPLILKLININVIILIIDIKNAKFLFFQSR
jgi:hypothetical protein